MFVSQGRQVLLVVKVRKQWSKNDPKQVLNMVLVLDGPLDFLVPSPALKAYWNALQKTADILNGETFLRQ